MKDKEKIINAKWCFKCISELFAQIEKLFMAKDLIISRKIKEEFEKYNKIWF